MTSCLFSRQECKNNIVTCHVSSQVGTDGHAGGVWVGNRVATVMSYLFLYYTELYYCTVL